MRKYFLLIVLSVAAFASVGLLLSRNNAGTRNIEIHSYSHVYDSQPVKAIASRRRISLPVAALRPELVWNGHIVFAGNTLLCTTTTGEPVWQLDPEAEFAKNVSLSDGVLYFASGSDFYAVNAEDGEVLWKTTVPDGEYADNPVIAHENVYFVTETGGLLYSLDRETGKQMWQYRLPEELQKPPFPFGNLVLLFLRDHVQALDPAGKPAGKPAWKADFKFGTPEWGQIVDGKALLLSSGAELHAITQSGKIDFSIDGIKTTPAVFDKVLCYPRTDQTIEAYDTATGAALWNHKLSDRAADGPVVQSGQAAFFVAVDGTITAVNATSGAELWKYSTGEKFNQFRAAKNKAALFVEADDLLVALDLVSGKKIWSAKIDFLGGGCFAASDEAILVSEVGNKLQAYDAQQGKLIWEEHTPGLSAKPIIAAGQFIFRSFADNAIHSRSLLDSTAQWSFRLEAGVLRYSPTVWQAENAVLVGYPGGRLTTFPPDIGITSEAFSTAYAPITCAPCVDEENMYIASKGGKITCSEYDGAAIWTFDARAEIVSPPIVAGPNLYFGDLGGKLHKLDRTTGKETWSSGSDSPIRTSPAVITDPASELAKVYFGNDAGEIYVAEFTGEKQKKEPPPRPTPRLLCKLSGAVSSSPTSDGTLLFAGDKKGNFYAIDRETGVIVWQYKADGAIYRTSACNRNRLYFSTNAGSLYALKAASGKVIWSRSGIKDDYTSDPALAGDVLYVGSYDGSLYAFDAATGTVRWSFRTDAPVVAAPAVFNGSIFLGSTDGFVYLIK